MSESGDADREFRKYELVALIRSSAVFLDWGAIFPFCSASSKINDNAPLKNITPTTKSQTLESTNDKTIESKANGIQNAQERFCADEWRNVFHSKSFFPRTSLDSVITIEYSDTNAW